MGKESRWHSKSKSPSSGRGYNVTRTPWPATWTPIKPDYGQLDAPRRWWQEATRRLTQEGWTPRDLDPCPFVLHHPQKDGSTTPRGLIALHVDDALGAGDRNCPTYAGAERRLKEAFAFRSWQEDHETMEYCVAFSMTARTRPCRDATSRRKSKL